MRTDDAQTAQEVRDLDPPVAEINGGRAWSLRNDQLERLAAELAEPGNAQEARELAVVLGELARRNTIAEEDRYTGSAHFCWEGRHPECDRHAERLAEEECGSTTVGALLLALVPAAAATYWLALLAGSLGVVA